jgi:hypothetical protein
MSVITPEGTLIIENSHLDVRGNVNAVALKLGTLRLTPSYDLAAVTGVGNTTPYTVEFSNATTGLATTSNLQVGGTLKLGGTVDFENPLSLAAVSLVSNTTPYTIEFSNAATGIATTANVDVGGELAVTGNATVSSNLTVTGNATVSSNLTVTGNATVGEELTVTGNATMTSNLTVTGDLNVSGALGILDAIYPVGTVIDRATAITDTHLNGKYKAFLGAPNQEWELKSSPELPVSFKVTYDQPGTITYSGQVIPMSIINSNIGSGWNAASNTFVAPRTGTYIFGALLNQSDQERRIIIRKNASNQTDVIEYAVNPNFIYAGHQNNTGTCMLNLNANDVIDLYAGTTAQGMDVTLQFNDANFHTSFSARFEFYGYLIDDSNDNYKYERTA